MNPYLRGNVRQRKLTLVIAPIGLLTWVSGQAPNRQVTRGAVIPSTGADYTFQHVVGIEIGPDGSILVLDPTEKSVLRFGARGEFRGRLGREGAGPGEFTWPLRMGMLKEQLWVFDGKLLRVNVFDKSLTPLSPQRMEKLGIVALLDGGAMATQLIPQQPHRLANVDTATVALLVNHADGRQDRVATWTVNPNPLTVQFPGFIATAGQPFVEAPLWDVTADGRSIILIHESKTGFPSLIAVSLTGQTRFRREIPWPRIPVTSAAYDRVVDSMVRHFEEKRPATVSEVPVDRDEVRRALVRPRDVSAVTQVLPGTDGRIWVRRRISRNDQWVEWYSFAADGTPESSALVPATAQVHLFTNRALWGVLQGDDGEPKVVEYLLPASLRRQ